MKLILALTALAFGWGERGHHAVARDAALSVLEGAQIPAGEEAQYRSLAHFFKAKAIQLGHLSNIPDTAWRSGDPLSRALNGPTHYSDADQWTVNFDTIPLVYAEALAKFHGKPNLVDGKPIDLFETGTLYWRAQEFYDLTRDAFARVKKAKPGSPELKAALKDALLHAGLLAHFVGDASMPYHNATDYDGWVSGNGGVHEYFETDSLYHAAPELEDAVFRRIPAQYRLFDVEGKVRLGGKQAATLLTRELGEQAFGRLLELRKLDDAFVVERSTRPADGKSRPAKRLGADEAFRAFRPMIEDQLSLSAAALARLWRLAWEEAGKPDLSSGHFWDYWHKPDFVPPAYDPEAVERVKRRLAKP